jgi:hypothetical protein
MLNEKIAFGKMIKDAKANPSCAESLALQICASIGY